MSVSHWRRSIGLGEVLVFLFILAFVRQYFWIFQSNRLAWTFTSVVTLGFWVLYVKFKDAEQERTPTTFWFIVCLPLLFFYLLRAPFPDISFDVVNYRLVQSERALRGAPFLAGDFAPVIFPLNPLPDLITGVARHFFGYRLGTIINYLTLVWVGLILNRLLREVVKNTSARSVVVLLILFTEHMLFQINTYMVDLLALPLLVEASRLTLNHQRSDNKQRDLVFVAFLLGTSLAIKLSNVTAVVPIALWFAFEFFVTQRRLSKTTFAIILAGFVTFFVPILPHAIYMYRDTGSPLFPLYNEIIQSPYWTLENVGDGRWGPVGVFQTLTWPLLSFLHSDRLSETGLYSGRLTFSVLAAVICLVLPRVSRPMRGLALVVLIGLLLWSATSGYVRYALVFELLGGVLIFYLITRLQTWAANRSKQFRLALVALPILIIGAQGVLAGRYAYQTEWSWRQTFFQDPKAYLSETRYFFHDHNLSKFLALDKKPLFWNVDAWIVSSVKSSGVEVLLRNDVPMIGVHNLQYFGTAKSFQRYRRVIAETRSKRMYTLVLGSEVEAARDNLRLRGLELGEPNPIDVRFYSDVVRLGMFLFEVKTIEAPPKPTFAVNTVATEALTFEALNAEISIISIPARFQRGAKQSITVGVKNISEFVWPSRGLADGRFFINVSNAWYDKDDKLVDNTDARKNIPFDLWPGDQCEVPLQITTPDAPGEYILELDMVQESVTFFQAKGSTVLRLKVIVE